MKRLTKALLMTISVMLMLGLAGASEYAYGSKVLPLDTDVGRPLFAVGANIQFWDTGVIPGYDDTDVVYLHFIGPTVSANDVRLTPFGDLPAGSKVTPQDNDIGQPLLPVFAPGQIRFADLYGGPQYDLEDPVYVHNFAVTVPPGGNLLTRMRDLRLTTVPGAGSAVPGLDPGTKVRNLDLDFPKALGLPVIAPGIFFPPGIIRFFDVNGNGVYDYSDDVYLYFPPSAPPSNSVTVNNVRLSGPVQ